MIKYTYNPPYNHWSGNRSDTLNKWKINYKGSIATASALPNEGEFKGDTYNVLEDGSNYMWNGTSWDKMDSNVFVGSTNIANGIQGLVPQPLIDDRGKYLSGGEGWKYLDASDVKTGVFDIARLPAIVTERLIQVADENARFALTDNDVNIGDTVLQQDTQALYRVVNIIELDNEDGYAVYQASTIWENIINRPNTITNLQIDAICV